MSFSTGDFLAVCRLIADIDSLLRDSRHDYQQISDQLQVLQTTLSQVAELDPPKEQMVSAAVIQATASKAKTSLVEFRDRIKRYEKSLGKGKSAGKLKDVEHKLLWGISGQAATAEKLQRELNSYVGSINMALGIYNLNHATLIAKKAEDQRDELQTAVKRSHQELIDMRQENQGQVAALFTRLMPDVCAISNMISRVLTMLQGLEEAAKQLRTQYPPLNTRVTWFQDPVVLYDALGRRIQVASEYSLGLVQTIIKFNFRKGPGSDCVRRGYYELFYSEDRSRKLYASEDTPLIPGSSITMAVWVRQKLNDGCSRSCCKGQVTLAPEGGYRCTGCGLWFDFDQSGRVQDVDHTEESMDQVVSQGLDTKREPRHSKGSASSDPFRYVTLTQPSDLFETLDSCQALTC